MPLVRRLISASAGTVTSSRRWVWLSINPGSKVALPRSIIVTPAGAFACTFDGAPTSLIFPFSIRTATGEATLPVRGSTRWPAFTRTATVFVF